MSKILETVWHCDSMSFVHEIIFFSVDKFRALIGNKFEFHKVRHSYTKFHKVRKFLWNLVVTGT